VDKVLRDPRGQAVLVVGQPGMGKTTLVNKMVEMAGQHPKRIYGSVCHEVTPNNSPYSTMEAMIEDAYRAADTSQPFMAKGKPKQWHALFKSLGVIPVAGSSLEALAELAYSLRRKPPIVPVVMT
jgi:Cdc6-like AAA superfamily ATPase